MHRRKFITLLGAAAAAWPNATRTQPRAMPVIGYLHSGDPQSFARMIAAFRDGLKEAGFVEGQNIAIEYRWAEGHYDRLPVLAADLVQRNVAVIATGGGENPARAVQALTATIPILFSFGGEPEKIGLVKSLNKPEGNLTGVIPLTTSLESKRLGLIHEMVPSANPIAALLNPTRSVSELQLAEVREAAARLGVDLFIKTASVEADFEPAFAAFAEQHTAALLVCADPYFFSRAREIVALAARYRIPAIYEWKDFSDVGGLMSYGTKLTDSYRQLGIYAGRLVKGVKVSELPVVQSSRFEFVINLNTAKALGLDVPPGLSARADEVIE
jgi:putative ABC transport system substrate-binding protein